MEPLFTDGFCLANSTNPSACGTALPGPILVAMGSFSLEVAPITAEATGAGNSPTTIIIERNSHSWRSNMEQGSYHLAPLALLSTLAYSLIGLGVFAAALFIIQKVTPFSIGKEIEQDQNTALAIIIGSVFISLAIIIQAAIR